MTLQKSKKSSRGRTPSGQPNPIDIHVGKSEAATVSEQADCGISAML